MAEAESLNTMFHDAFVKNGDGDFSLQTTTSIEAGQSVVYTLPIGSQATSVTANGKVTTPAAAANIAATPDLAAGTWDIEVTVFIAGTTVANLEMDNTKFNIGVTAVATIIVPVSGTAGATANGVFHIRVNLGGPTPVKVTVAATATTGAIYAASIIATRIQ